MRHPTSSKETCSVLPRQPQVAWWRYRRPVNRRSLRDQVFPFCPFQRRSESPEFGPDCSIFAAFSASSNAVVLASFLSDRISRTTSKVSQNRPTFKPHSNARRSSLKRLSVSIPAILHGDDVGTI